MKYNTLFLDRDGVINQKINGGYVTNIDEFEFIPKVLKALEFLAKNFTYIFMVTNQQGIGKGIFSMNDLERIHAFMMDKITQAGGRIDKIYVAPNLESENHINRKPQPGMAWQAKKEYPDVDFSRAMMVGDSSLDMQFGKNVGMTTILLTNGAFDNSAADYFFKDLYDFSTNALKIL